MSNHIEKNEQLSQPNDLFAKLYIDTDNPINCFSNQYVFLSGDKEEISTQVIFKKKRTIIKITEFYRLFHHKNICSVYLQ